MGIISSISGFIWNLIVGKNIDTHILRMHSSTIKVMCSMDIISSISGFIWNLIAGKNIDSHNLTYALNYNVHFEFCFVNIRFHLRKTY